MYLAQDLYQIHQLLLTHFYLHFGMKGVQIRFDIWKHIIFYYNSMQFLHHCSPYLYGNIFLSLLVLLKR